MEQAWHASEVDLDLSDADIEAYRTIAAGRSVDDEAAVSRLEALRLIDQAAGRQVALDPRVAAQQLLATQREALIGALDRMERIPHLEALAEHYDPGRMYGGPASEFVPSKALMGARIGQVLDDASSELLTVQPREPSERDPDVHREGVQRARAMLSRGVTVNSLYAASALHHPATCGYIDGIVSAGGEVRIGRTLPPRMVLVDRRHLFINNHVVPAEANAGWHVSDVAAVAWGRDVFTGYWNEAIPWQQALKATEGAVTNSRQRAILRELEAGHPQSKVGERVQLSERAVSGELAALRDALGMRSTYQLMAWWGGSEERALP
jgi:DNA-binding CsgD family transcriptional regulator